MLESLCLPQDMIHDSLFKSITDNIELPDFNDQMDQFVKSQELGESLYWMRCQAYKAEQGRNPPVPSEEWKDWIPRITHTGLERVRPGRGVHGSALWVSRKKRQLYEE